ncbi:MAG: hypothetical protein GY801_11635, partial [bacterium]|nr:hypothetical protein [bacterium]
QAAVNLPEARVADAITVCQAQVKVEYELSRNPVSDEDPESTVNMTIDSVLIAFLLNNTLLQYQLQFFTDGYSILHEAIRRCFSWYPRLGIIVDWYHLEEKCQRQLS